MTLNENDNIKDLFSSKLKGFEVEPPTLMWAGLEEMLPPENVPVADVSSATTSASKISMVGYSIAAVAAVATTVCLFIPSSDEEQINIEPIVEVIEESEETKGSSSTAILDVVVDDNTIPFEVARDTYIASNKSKHSEATSHGVLSDEYAVPTDEYISSNGYANLGEPVKNRIHTVDRIAEPLDENLQERKKAYRKAEDLDLADNPLTKEEEVLAVPQPKKESHDSGFGFGVHTGVNALASNSEGLGRYDMLFSHIDRSTVFSQGVRADNKNVKLKHSQPISVGILVSKKLNNLFSIESGLVYTRLSSKASTSGAFGVAEKQKFDYLGIPINVNYTFLHLGKAEFYASGGFMFQKDVNGSYTSMIDRGVGGPVLPNSSYKDSGFTPEFLPYVEAYMHEPALLKESIHQSHIQCSLHGLLGASFPIYRRLYIYGSAGVAYYFDAKNKYRTIYSDRQTQLDVKFGFRFKF